MDIAGFQKTTLLDYPGHVAATIFLSGCNFRCVFCHNKDLVLLHEHRQTYCTNEILSFLNKRKNILDGICITGGEPTLHPGLYKFIEDVRQLGLKIKLDTNGYQPDLLIKLCESGLVNYIAMDIKASKDSYAAICNISDFEISRIEASVDYLLRHQFSFEFRTTVIREFHSEAELIKIGKWIQGAPAYYLQKYEDSEQVIAPGHSSYSGMEMEYFASILRKFIRNVKLRGTSGDTSS